MKKLYTICATVLTLNLVSCVEDFGRTSNNNGAINQPGNLIADTSSIAKSGSSTIRISNIGELPVVINDGTMEDNQTNDDIDNNRTDCYGKTLNQNQSCSLIIKVYSGEAGISTIKLNTSNGVYKINLNVDTSGEGVIDTDLKSLQTTKERTVNVINKGAMPITLTKFNLESGNSTLSVVDSNCLGKTLDSGQSCQLKAQASAGQNRHHVLYMTTSNEFMAIQQVPLNEITNKNTLSLSTESDDVNPIAESSPGVKYWTITNSGSNDIHISRVKLDNTNIGSIANNTCDGKLLQAGDNCDIAVNVNQNAYGSDKLVINTAETLTKGSEYAINIDSNNLTIDGGSNDVIMHTNTSKTVNIKNTSNFDISVDNIQFNNQELNLDSTCKNILKPYDTCTISLKAFNTQNDNSSFTFNEFGGGFTKKINVHINNGVSIVNENPGSSFYNVLPQDNNFYQVFTVYNPTNTTVHLDTMIRNGSVTTVLSNSMPNYVWILPSCVDNNGDIANISANSTCELILKEPRDYNSLQDLINDQSNPDKGNFRLQINYNETGDILLQKYQGYVISHNVHRNQTYPAGATIANYPIPTGQKCDIPNNGLVTYFAKHRGCEIIHGGGQICSDIYQAVVLYTDLEDMNTIYGKYYEIEENQPCQYGERYKFSLSSYNKDTVVDSHIWDDGSPLDHITTTNTMLSGSNCNDTNCNLLFSINLNGTLRGYANFQRPLPAADWFVADKVVWQNLGSATLAKVKKVAF